MQHDVLAVSWAVPSGVTGRGYNDSTILEVADDLGLKLKMPVEGQCMTMIGVLGELV